MSHSRQAGIPDVVVSGKKAKNNYRARLWCCSYNNTIFGLSTNEVPPSIMPTLYFRRTPLQEQRAYSNSTNSSFPNACCPRGHNLAYHHGLNTWPPHTLTCNYLNIILSTIGHLPNTTYVSLFMQQFWNYGEKISKPDIKVFLALSALGMERSLLQNLCCLIQFPWDPGSLFHKIF